MRRLMLLRHAKSSWSEPDARDHDRPLAARGQEAAPRIGAYMASHDLVPDRVLCSTARRARQTWELVGAALSAAPPVVYDERLYDASADAILEAVKETDVAVHNLLVVGHNPGLHDLARYLIGTGDIDARQSLAEKFPTAALAVIDLPFDSWSRIHRGSGRLDRLVTPRSLALATD